MRLIDVDKLPRHGGRGGIVHWSDIEKAPTVDAVPVIRCKDCKYSVDEYDDGECYCDYEKDLRYIKDWDHYCAWAERKEK